VLRPRRGIANAQGLIVGEVGGSQCRHDLPALSEGNAGLGLRIPAVVRGMQWRHT
jgi:hypothetical protein